MAIEDCALILGGAACVWDDVTAAMLMADVIEWPGPIIVANDVGVDWPKRIDHWVSRHPDRLTGTEFKQSWAEQRMRKDFPSGYETWSVRDPRLVEHVIPDWKGSDSGLLAVKVALIHLEIPRAILCGIPMTKSPHWDGRREARPWRHADIHWKAWVRNMNHLRRRLKSFSGRTREIFRAPTLPWARGDL